MFKRIKKRSKEDDGNAVILLGIMLIMAILLVGGIMLDLSKAYQIKSSYVDSAKKATQTAIMKQNTDGYLKPESVGEVVRVYENIVRPSVINPDGYFAKCEDWDDDDVNLSVYLKNEKTGHEMLAGSIRRSYVNDSDTAEQLTQKMSVNKNLVRSGKFTSIKLTVTEGTENVVLPGAFLITQSSKEEAANMKCQKLEIGARASIFLGDREGLYD